MSPNKASTPGAGIYYETVRRTLQKVVGDAPDAAAVADAALGTWRQLVVHLVPVIGARGVDALFNRSLYVVRKIYPWLGLDGVDDKVAALLPELRARIAVREPVEATEASCIFLVTFTQLLANLIGDSLTKRLLITVWEPASDETEQEHANGQ